jgi:phosphoribosylamine--glycine ligase
VASSAGYPGKYKTGLPITGLAEAAKLPDVQVFHAGSALKDGQVVTAGGRVLGVTAVAPSLEEALARAYEAIKLLHFDGIYYRNDIGHRALLKIAEAMAKELRDGNARF